MIKLPTLMHTIDTKYFQIPLDAQMRILQIV